MKKRFMRFCALAGMTVMMALSAVGCSKKVECDMCGEVKKCKSQKIDGEKVYLCEDCEAIFEALGSLFN